MQGCLEFPSLVDLTIYLLDLHEEVSLSLRITVNDSLIRWIIHHLKLH